MDLDKQQKLQGLILLSNQPESDEWKRKVVAIIQQPTQTKIIGLCINRPLRLTLHDFELPLKDFFETIPVYNGGPVHPKSITIAGIAPHPENRSIHWQFDCSMSQLANLIQRLNITFKAYCGHIAWEQKQLTAEIQQRLWLPIPFPLPAIFPMHSETLWETLMLKFYPFALNASYLPETPSLN